MGSEYQGFQSFIASYGIIHWTSCLHSSEQNGLAKRKHRHMVEISMAMLSNASLPFSLWDEAFFSSFFVINQ